MRVNSGGNVFVMSFQHEPDWKPEKAEKKIYPRHVVGRTLCRISRLDIKPECPRHGSEFPEGQCICPREEIAVGMAFCSGKDQYNKETGRRAALTTALQQAFPAAPNKRAPFWQAYLARVPKKERG